MKNKLFNHTLMYSIVASMMLPSIVQAQEESLKEEVLVTGIRGALENALDIKRDAKGFVDAISSEDIGKFPDQNIAESLQRVTGVTIDRLGGEGSSITVRGFGPEFNSVRVNNRQLATISGGRDFDFQVLASELIHGAEVAKTPSASLVEGSIGAAINMKTLRPLDNPGLKVVGSAKLRYQDLAEETAPVLSGLVSNTFADDTMGIVFAASYSDIEQRIDRTWNGVWGAWEFDVNNDGVHEGEYIRRPNRAGFGFAVEDRERLGLSSTFQWSPNDTVEVTVDALLIDFNRSERQVHNMHPMQVAFGRRFGDGNNVSSLTVNERGTLVAVNKADQPNDMGLELSGGDITTEALGTNIVWNISDTLTAEFDLSYSKATAEDLGVSMFPGMRNDCSEYVITTEPTVEGSLADCTPARSNADNGSNAVQWRLGHQNATIQTSFDMTDASLLRSHFNNSARDDTEDEIFEVKVDFDQALEFGPLTTIQFGAAFLDRRFDDIRFDNQNVTGWNPFGEGSTWSETLRGMDPDGGRSNGRRLDLPDGLFEVISVPDLLEGAQGPFPKQWVITRDYDDLCDAMAELSGNNLGCTLTFIPRESSFVEETNLAAYIQFDLEGEIGSVAYSGDIGFRYIQSETSSNGFTSPLIGITPRDPTGGTTGLDPQFGEEIELIVDNDYSDVLPSANFKFELTDEVLLRVAASKTLTRPDTADLGTAVTYGGSFEGFTRTGDNPFLEPYEALNFDLGLEYYAENNNAFGITLFYKDIDSFISTVVTPFDSGFSHPALGPILGDDRRLRNRPGGTVEGFEISGLIFFDFLDGVWSNFGLQANYTYVSGEDKSAADVVYPDPENVTLPDSNLEGFTPHSYNLIAFYEDERFQARLAYNLRDDYMNVRVGNGQLPEHFDAYEAIDFSSSYQINDTFTLVFEALNLGNENVREYADHPERMTDNEWTGRRYTFGVRADF